jgi:hypothetical protein
VKKNLSNIFFKQHRHHQETSKQYREEDEGKEGWWYGTAGVSDARS